MKTELVKQKTGSDCGLAAIAMALGKSHEDVWEQKDIDLVVKEKGIGDWEPWLKKAGIYRSDYSFIYIHGQHQDSVKNLLFARPAILSVASLNNNQGLHAVYFDGFNLYDPSQQRTYQFLSSCLINHVIALRPDIRAVCELRKRPEPCPTP